MTYKEEVDEIIKEISGMDFIVSFDLHRLNFKHHLFVRGIKDGQRKDFTIILNKYNDRKSDSLNPRLAPVFRSVIDDIDDVSKKTVYSEIITNKPFVQENTTISKYFNLRRMFKEGNGKLCIDDPRTGKRHYFDTAFLNTKVSHLMFQTNIFKNDIDLEKVDINQLNICYYDIETSAGRLDEQGGRNTGDPFSDIKNQENVIRSIVTYSSKADKFFVFVYKDFDEEFIKKQVSTNIHYDDKVDESIKERFNSISDKIVKVYCKNEAELLHNFILHIRKNYDLMVGWNSDNFDLPFIVSRIRTTLGEDFVNKMSPFNSVNLIDKEFEKRSWDIEIAGIPHVDLQQMYELFKQEKQMSYSLNHIMEVEAGINKIEKTFDSYDDFYAYDFDTYILYNIQDVNGLREIDLATNFINLALLQSSESKININDTYSKVQLHTFAMIDYLLKEKKVYANDKLEQPSKFIFDGAFVLANIGAYSMLKSRDFTSLYPTILIEFNMSLDTIFYKKDYDEMVKLIGEENIISTLDPNIFFRKDFIGVSTQYVLKNFKARKHYKNLMKDHEKDSKLYILYDNLQYNQKIKINSFYGTNGTNHFYFAKEDIASMITAFGRELITSMQHELEVTNANVDIMNDYYNQNIYDLNFEGKNFKVFDYDMVDVFRDGSEQSVFIKDLVETDKMLQLQMN